MNKKSPWVVTATALVSSIFPSYAQSSGDVPTDSSVGAHESTHAKRAVGGLLETSSLAEKMEESPFEQLREQVKNVPDLHEEAAILIDDHYLAAQALVTDLWERAQKQKNPGSLLKEASEAQEITAAFLKEAQEQVNGVGRIVAIANFLGPKEISLSFMEALSQGPSEMDEKKIPSLWQRGLFMAWQRADETLRKAQKNFDAAQTVTDPKLGIENCRRLVDDLEKAFIDPLGQNILTAERANPLPRPKPIQFRIPLGIEKGSSISK